ncbi:hypothetical protein ACQUSR_00485 [Streptomyces sp. P1-3]
MSETEPEPTHASELGLLGIGCAVMILLPLLWLFVAIVVAYE